MQTPVNVQVGRPLRWKAMSVFPLFIKVPYRLDYLLCEDSKAGGDLILGPTNLLGQTNLMAENRSDKRILMPAGTPLVVAKSRASLKVSVFLPPRHTTKIPASAFVDDAFPLSEACSKAVQECDQAFEYVTDASGLVVAVSRHVLTLDIFDKPPTCQRVWGRLIGRFAGIAAQLPPTRHHSRLFEVQKTLSILNRAPWMPVKAIGEGEAHEAAIDRGYLASLSFDGCLVHASMVLQQGNKAFFPSLGS